MTLQISLIVLGLLILTFGADFLVRGAGSVALRFGVTPLVVGLTVVAFGTSAPEMVVSLKAASVGQGDIAAGNVIGSNIFNIAVILGLAAMISPMRVQLQLLKFDAPIMLVTAGILVGVFWDRRIEQWEGILLFAGIIAYVIFNVIASRKQHTPAIDAEYEEGMPQRTKSPWVDALLILGGLAMLVGGSRLLVDNAVALARGLGVSEAVIGLTIIAAGTSMPELATSVVAAIKKEADIAIGNIVGSNIFNVLAIMGISGTFTPFSAPGIASVDLWVMLGLSAALVPLLVTGNRLVRWEGAVLFASFIGYTLLKWPK
ncbi:MAG: calcium/sodium antiporter [Verrucomicrobiales bacterium]